MIGAARFTAESQAMIDSPTVPPIVKPIFKRFIAAIAAAKPCVAQANLKCILNTYKNVGVTGMEQGVKLSTGKLRQLFQKLLKLDRQAVKEMGTLPKDAGQLAVKLSEFVLNFKASIVQIYLEKGEVVD